MECSVCNSAPGKQTKIEFVDSGKSVSLPLCDDCYADFSADEGLTVTRISE